MMLKRLVNYLRTYRRKGAASMDHALWLYWIIFNRYPA